MFLEVQHFTSKYTTANTLQMYVYIHVHIQIHSHVPTSTFYLSILCTQTELWQLTEDGISDFSVLGLAQLLRKEKDFLSVLAFYTTAIEANKAKVKSCKSTCKSAKNSHVPVWKATHMAIITLRSTVQYCHPERRNCSELSLTYPKPVCDVGCQRCQLTSDTCPSSTGEELVSSSPLGSKVGAHQEPRKYQSKTKLTETHTLQDTGSLLRPTSVTGYLVNDCPAFCTLRGSEKEAQL